MKAPRHSSPAELIASLDGWRRTCVLALRKAVREATELEEVLKWGNLVYVGRGPVLMIRAEPERVLFGFWRGQRLRELEPRLKPGGKYEMATVELREGDRLAPAVARELARAAWALDSELGNPQAAAPRSKRGARRPAAARPQRRPRT